MRLKPYVNFIILQYAHLPWLEYLVRDYKVSPMWLITGDGSFFLDGWSAPSVIALQQK